jgi:hypothetical protein
MGIRDMMNGTISIDINISDVLSQISDTQLLDEAANRGLIAKNIQETWIDLTQELRSVIKDDDQTHLDIVLNRMSYMFNGIS